MGSNIRKATKRETEIRVNNRYNLHPIGKKQCSQCEIIYDDIASNFDIKKRNKNGTYTYDGWCKPCRIHYRAELKERQKKDGKWYFSRLLSQVRCRAKKENLDYDLDAEYLNELWNGQDGKCYYTGEPMDLLAYNENRKSPHHNFPSLDKMNPLMGYVRGNVVWTRWAVNRAKSDYTTEQFIDMCKRVTNLHG